MTHIKISRKIRNKPLAWFIFPAVFSLSVCSQAFANKQMTKPNKDTVTIDQPDTKNLNKKVINRFTKLIREEVWDIFSEITVYEKSNDDFSIGLDLDRNVQPSSDGLYLVTDSIKVPMNINLFSKTLSKAGSSLPISFSVGASLLTQINNIRVVQAAHPMVKNESAETEKFKQETKNKFKESLALGKAKKDIHVTTYDSPKILGKEVSPETYVRYTNSLERITFLGKVPFKAKTLSDLEDYEIIRFRSEGTLSGGPSIGYDILPLDMRLRAGIRVFTGGAFETSVMPFTDGSRKVLVRIRLLSSTGVSASIGGRYESDINDFSLADQINEDHNSKGNNRNDDKSLTQLALDGLKIIPFDYNVTYSKGSAVEVIYSFDLDSPDAINAYEQMILGQTELADAMAIRDKDLKKAPVVSLLQSTATSQTKQVRNSIRYIIYKKGKVCANGIGNDDAEYREGKYQTRTFSSACHSETNGLVNDDKDSSSLLAGGFIINKDTHHMDYGFSASVKIYNQKTKGHKLYEYINSINTILGEELLSTNKPVMTVKVLTPEERKNRPISSMSEANPNHQVRELKYHSYDNTNILLQIKFSQKQIFKFASTPLIKIRPIMFTAFEKYINDEVKKEVKGNWLIAPKTKRAKRWLHGSLDKVLTFIPQLFVAGIKGGSAQAAMGRFETGWEELSTLFNTRQKFSVEDMQEAVNIFGKKVLNDPEFTNEYLTAIILAIKDQEYDNYTDTDINYELTASGEGFADGAPLSFSQGVTPIETYNQYLSNLRVEQTFPFDNPARAKNYDPDASISSLQAGTNKEHDLFIVDFVADEKPELVRINFIAHKERNIVASIDLTSNGNQPFKQSANRYTIKISELIKLSDEARVGNEKGIQRGKDYRISLSFSQNKDSEKFGGSLYSNTFTMPKK